MPANGALVSIVIPCYNYGRFLAEAIESALAQTYRPIEITVVDDGSTDDTVEVASRYVPSIRLVTHKNMGFIHTCNRAVGEARGEYVTILSSDDRCEPTYVQALLEGLEADPASSYAYSDMRLFGTASGVRKAWPFSPALLLAGNYINGSALTRRADYLAVGGYSEDLHLIGYEDWDLWLRLLEHGKRGAYVAEPLLLYRQHEEQSRNPRRQLAMRRAARDLRRRHPALYGRRPLPVTFLLLKAALAAAALGCRPCLARLDRAWGLAVA